MARNQTARANAGDWQPAASKCDIPTGLGNPVELHEVVMTKVVTVRMTLKMFAVRGDARSRCETPTNFDYLKHRSRRKSEPGLGRKYNNALVNDESGYIICVRWCRGQELEIAQVCFFGPTPGASATSSGLGCCYPNFLDPNHPQLMFSMFGSGSVRPRQNVTIWLTAFRPNRIENIIHRV